MCDLYLHILAIVVEVAVVYGRPFVLIGELVELVLDGGFCGESCLDHVVSTRDDLCLLGGCEGWAMSKRS
jgi:predicted nucleic acid-binding Zn finger protein